MEAFGNQLEPLRAMLFQIGAFLPRWFMRDSHAAPHEAVRAAPPAPADAPRAWSSAIRC